MAKGKFAKRAEIRRDEAATTTTIADYQSKVARLTAENRDLRERLTAQDRAAKQIERRLRAERDEGVAPQVSALTEALRQAVEGRDQAQRRAQGIGKRWELTFQRLRDHFMEAHKEPAFEATESAARIMGAMNSDSSIMVSDGGVVGSLDQEQVKALQRKQGLRR